RDSAEPAWGRIGECRWRPDETDGRVGPSENRSFSTSSVRTQAMVSATASRSSMGRRAQTCGLATSRMVAPPCHAYSLEGRNQLFNGGGCEDGRFGARFRRQIRARDGDGTNSTREDFNLAVPDMARKRGEPREFQRPAVEGLTRIGDSDLALAFFRDLGGITLDEVPPPPAGPGSAAPASPGARRRSPARRASTAGPPAGTRSR